MERIGEDLVTYIFKKIADKDDQKSFSQVSKQFLSVACFPVTMLRINSPNAIYVILPACPNIRKFVCSKPLSNDHMEFLAKWCPKLRFLYLGSGEDLDHQVDYRRPGELDFDDSGLCAVACGCKSLLEVDLSRRLHVGDVGVCCLVRSNRRLFDLVLEGCVGVTDKSLEAIGEARCLERLDLGGCYKITDLGLKYLALGKLEYLDLSKCGLKVTDTGILFVSEISNIRKLDVSWLINVTDTSLFNIASNCLKLGMANFSGCEAITGEGLRAFAHHPTLEILEIFSCHNISWEDVVSVGSTCKGLIRLGLSRRMRSPVASRNDSFFLLGGNCFLIHWND